MGEGSAYGWAGTAAWVGTAPRLAWLLAWPGPWPSLVPGPTSPLAWQDRMSR
jgi:hypothetical protein